MNDTSHKQKKISEHGQLSGLQLESNTAFKHRKGAVKQYPCSSEQLHSVFTNDGNSGYLSKTRPLSLCTLKGCGVTFPTELMNIVYDNL